MQAEVVSSLDYISSQQQAIENELDKMEEHIKSVWDTSNSGDEGREKVYEMAEEIDRELTALGREVGDMITGVNNSWENGSAGNEAETEPVRQIVKTLNSHLNTLSWIDSETNRLQRKVHEAGRLVQ